MTPTYKQFNDGSSITLDVVNDAVTYDLCYPNGVHRRGVALDEVSAYSEAVTLRNEDILRRYERGERIGNRRIVLSLA